MFYHLHNVELLKRPFLGQREKRIPVSVIWFKPLALPSLSDGVCRTEPCFGSMQSVKKILRESVTYFCVCASRMNSFI